jgi:hypothetical protein
MTREVHTRVKTMKSSLPEFRSEFKSCLVEYPKFPECTCDDKWRVGR